MELLKANHGGNIWADHHKPINPNWNPAVYWQIQGKQLRPFLQNIVNHLIIKREQAKLCIWWLDRCVGKPFNKNGQIDLVRQSARDELKAMKLDPHRLSGKAIQALMKIIDSMDGCDSRTER